VTNSNELLSDELLLLVQQTAQAQHRQPAEVIADAVRGYVERQEWQRFVESNERRARAKGIVPEDVDRLISEVRRENASGL
jgi:predicted transcriptional regulator